MSGYGSDDDFQTYADAAGYTLPSGDVVSARQRGSVYIDGAYGWRFPGVPTGGLAQERAWPRTGALDFYGNAIDTAIIPACVVNASYEAAFLELSKPGSLAAFTSGAKQISSLKAGSVAIDYAKNDGMSSVDAARPFSTLIDGMLVPVIGPCLLPGVLVV